jgi:hypothetical protein
LLRVAYAHASRAGLVANDARYGYEMPPAVMGKLLMRQVIISVMIQAIHIFDANQFGKTSGKRAMVRASAQKIFYPLDFHSLRSK